MVHLLLSSVGRRVELVRSFQRAARSLDVPLRIVGTDIDWLAPGLHVVDQGYLVPAVEHEAFVPQLLEICRRESVDLMLPLIDPEIPILARTRSPFEALGVQLGVVEPPAAEIASDKWKTVQFFQRLELAVPTTWLPDAMTIPIEFPCFIKPRNGSAAQDAHRIASREELEFYLPRVPNPIVQEFLPGPEITTDVICDLAGNFLACASRQRIAVRGGEVVKSVTVKHPDIRSACERIARHLPARGPFTLQCLMKQGVPAFIEINARLGGGLPLAIAAGLDVPAILIALASGKPCQHLLREPEQGLFMTRCDESIFVREDAREPLGRSDL